MLRKLTALGGFCVLVFGSVLSQNLKADDWFYPGDHTASNSPENELPEPRSRGSG